MMGVTEEKTKPRQNYTMSLPVNLNEEDCRQQDNVGYPDSREPAGTRWDELLT